MVALHQHVVITYPDVPDVSDLPHFMVIKAIKLPLVGVHAEGSV